MTQLEQDPELQRIAQETKNWVERVVMKYNICPFARREVERGSIRYTVIEESKIHMVLQAFIAECEQLDANPEIETTLFVLPRGFEGFYPYLDLVDMASDLLLEQGYEGVYQLATMHPDYCFDGEPMDEPSNYTNRSPYPMLHIIREKSMEHALANYNDPESIPERNIKFTQRKGSDFFAKLLSECFEK